MLLYANMVAAKPTAKTLEIATVFILSVTMKHLEH